MSEPDIYLRNQFYRHHRFKTAIQNKICPISFLSQSHRFLKKLVLRNRLLSIHKETSVLYKKRLECSKVRVQHTRVMVVVSENYASNDAVSGYKWALRDLWRRLHALHCGKVTTYDLEDYSEVLDYEFTGSRSVFEIRNTDFVLCFVSREFDSLVSIWVVSGFISIHKKRNAFTLLYKTVKKTRQFMCPQWGFTYIRNPKVAIDTKLS